MNFRYGLYLKLILLWLGINLLLWFSPTYWNTAKTVISDWRREHAASFYETRFFTEVASGSPRLPYLFFRPDPLKSSKSNSGKAPLVIVLHGSGERGGDCRRQLTTVGTFLVEPSFQASHPCFVVAPQCPENANWLMAPELDVEKAVEGIINDVIASESIDEDRIYLMGYSMGAYGCWHYLASMPDRFAGCIAIAGGGDPDMAAQITGTAVWAIHGENDDVVLPEQSQQMVEAVVGAGGDARLTLLKGVGHRSLEVVSAAPNAYLEWLFEQRRSVGGDDYEDTSASR